MEGEIHTSLYNPSIIKVFMIRENIPGFEGSISTSVGKLKNLTHLVLSDNPLTGTLSSELGICEDLGKIHFFDKALALVAAP